MRISLNWLKQYIDFPKNLTPEELSLKLTMSTVEVEEIIKQADKFANMVVGEVMEVVDHPQADKLKVLKVKAGKEVYQVVCGGVNARVGLKSILALPGAMVKWHGQGELQVIAKTKIRGIESTGMLCAAEELSLSAPYYSEYFTCPEMGVIDLRFGKPGQSAAEALGQDDVIFEVDNKSITNRPDLWGHYGIAREVAALFDLKLKELKIEKFKEGSEADLKIKIEDHDNCSRYLGAIVDGIVIEPSPVWLQRLLESAGVRPINNVVDITNFVMLELGRPSHAFDRRDVEGDTIIVRRAHAGEKFKTLDGQDRVLTGQMCLVCDAKKPVDLAGIMGGANSEIKNDTKQIILELANFNPVNIRKTAQSLNLRTEAATRFEKSLDPALAELGFNRIMSLLVQLIPSAKIISKIVDVNLEKETPRLISLPVAFVQAKIGAEISKKQIIGILESLSFGVKEKNDVLEVVPPSFRVKKDISLPEDLVEEVARIYGFENIKPILPVVALAEAEENIVLKLRRSAQDILFLGCGATEVYNYAFVGLKNLALLGLNPEDHLQVANFLTEDQKYLKTTLFECLVKNLQDNLRFYKEINIFELGRAFTKRDGIFAVDQTNKEYLADQGLKLAGLVYQEGQESFFKVKGLVEALVKQLEVDFEYHLPKTRKQNDLPIRLKPESYLELKAGEEVLGWIGELSDNIQDQLELKDPVAVWQIDFDLLTKYAQDKKQYSPLPKYPGINYDFSVIVPNSSFWAEIKKEVAEASPLIKRVQLFDLYQMPQGAGSKRSLAFHVFYQDETKTLASAEVEKLNEKIINLLKKKFKAEIR